MLQFDNDYLVAVNLFESRDKKGTTRGLHMPSKSEIGNPTLIVIGIASYFILCFTILVVLCIIWNVYEMNLFNEPSSSSDLTDDEESEVQILTAVELIFTVMCILPFGFIMFWVPHSIWDIVESWKIRDELVFIFIATSS